MKALKSRRAALGAILAAPLATASAGAAAGHEPPSDLARACLWAVRHRAWVDTTAHREWWSDELLELETDRVDFVFARAVAEPSRNLQDLAAKAALALEDFERFVATPGQIHDDGVRIVHTVLREAVALLGRGT